MTPERIASEAGRLLESEGARSAMRQELAKVTALLSTDRDPLEAAAERIERMFSEDTVHAR
jgi:hypothetical protein